MANARDVYNVDANKAGLSDPQNRQFDLSFPYLSQSHVSVTVNGTATTAFTYATSTRIQLNTGPTAGDVVVIQRATSPNTRLVDYQTGSVLSDEILDRDSLQAFYLAQEANDVAEIVLSKNASNLFDAGNERITNVANPTGAQDVATKNYLENTWLSSSDKTQLNALNTTNLNTVAGAVSNVNTVAGAITNVNTVAGKSTEIAALGTSGNVSNMDTLAASGVVGNIASVAGISSDVTTVAGKASLITSDFVSDLNTVAVTDVINDINLLAHSDVVSDLNQLATSDFVSDLNQLATTTNVNNLGTVAGIAGNVTSVAGVASDVSTVAGISSAVSTVAADGTDIGTVAGISSAVSTVSSNNANVSTVAGAVSNIGTVAGAVSNVNSVGSSIGNVNTVAGISSAVSTVAADATDIGNVSGSITNVNTVATNISGVNSFAAQYRTGSSDPTSSLDEGDLFYNTTANQLKIYNGSAWENAAPAGSGFLATSGGTMTGNLALGDNVKATFGSGDLQIFHDGLNSYLSDTGTGDIIIKGDYVRLQDSGGTNLLTADGNDAVSLFYGGGSRLSTTTSGINVTGTVQADQFNNDEALPDIRPSLLLDFANSKTLDPRITFTRGSTATYYDGHTTAKAEENLFKYSQDFTTSNWAKNGTATTGDNTTAPDSTTTADLIEVNTSGSFRGIYQNAVVPASTVYTASVYVKKSNYDYIRLALDAHLGNTFVVGLVSTDVNISNGTVISSSGTNSVTDVGNGWYRITVTVTTPSSGADRVRLWLFFANSSGTPNDTIPSGSQVYLWGAQLEQRSAATAYTPTTSAPVVKYQPVLQTAASGEARFDHDPTTGESKGLLIEEARTNLLPYSGAFDNGQWNKTRVNITANNLIAPDGTLTADTLIADTNSAEHYIQDNLTAATGTFTDSVYAKSSGDYLFAIRPVHVGADQGATQEGYFNLNTGTVHSTSSGTTASIEDVGNGWYRCSLTHTVSGTLSGSYAFRIQIYENDGSGGTVSIYAGDGYSGVYLWGAQREAGSFPTSYIATSGSTATRASDLPIMSGSNFTDWFNSIPLSGYVEYDFQTSAINQRLFSIDTNGYDPRLVAIGSVSNGYGPTIELYADGNFYTTLTSGATTPTETGTHKMAFAFADNDAANSKDGAAVVTDTSFVFPSNFSQLRIGSQANGVNLMQGTIKKLAFYPKRLPNATLKAMTTE